MLHYKTIESALNKYLPLHIAGGTEEEVKNAIALDDKKFEEAGVNEIYAAILAYKEGDGDKGTGGDKGNNSKAKRHVVIAPFRDIADFNLEWAIGADVSHFEAGRLKKLTEQKLVELK